MTIRIKREFHDRNNFAKVYKVGDIVEFEKGRANRLISLDIAELVTPKRRERRQQ